MTNPLTFKKDGTVDWIHHKDDLYVATGVDTRGKRFKPIRSEHWHYINGINLYRGTKWLVRGGKRYRIQTVWN
jgi:hypothetical protein